MSEAYPRLMATWPPEVLDIRLFELWAVLAIGWVAGFAVRIFYGPTAVGEIMGGILLGPTYLDIVPYVGALQEFGRLGLGIALFDAGLRVEVVRLALPGTIRSTLIGAAPPAVLAAAILYATHHMSLLECIGGGCVMFSSSTASALALAEFPDASTHGKELRQEIPGVAFLTDAAALTAMAITTSYASSLAWWPPVQSALSSILLLNIVLFLRRAITPVLSGFLKAFADPPFQKPVDSFSRSFCHATTLLFAAVVAVGLMLLAQLFLSTWLLAAPLAALVFSGAPQFVALWNEQVSANLRPWALRVFLTLSVGLAVPRGEWIVPGNILAGLWVALVAWGGRAAPPLALTVPMGTRATAVRACQLSVALMGRDEVGLAIALELRRHGVLSDTGFCISFWAVLFSSFAAPFLFRSLAILASNIAPLPLLPAPLPPPLPAFGPGIIWTMEGDALLVAGFAPGCLAPQYGVGHGDRLLAVDGVSVAEMGVQADGQHQAGALLAGLEGSACSLDLQTPGIGGGPLTGEGGWEHGGEARLNALATATGEEWSPGGGRVRVMLQRLVRRGEGVGIF